MAPLTKDAVETANSAKESAATQTGAQAKPAGGHTRSDAVSLEVPVKVHGSRVKEVRGAAPQTEPFEEQTSTMIVFPQGGVLRMNTSANVGQMLVLTNLKSRQDAICRVVKVRSFPNMQSYVEVEFTHAQPGYWGVYFPAAGAPAPSGAAKPALSVAPPPAVTSPVTPPAVAPPPESKPPAPLNVSWAPAPNASSAKPAETVVQSTPIPAKPAKPAAAAKPESSFASIGTKEEVLPAADSTRPPRSAIAGAIEKEISAAQPSKPSAAAAEQVAPPSSPSLSLGELRGDEDAISAVLASLEEESQVADTKVAEQPKAKSHESSASSFGARLDIGLGTATAKPAEPKQNWLLIAACIAVLLGAVGGGVWYFYPKTLSQSGAALSSQQAAAPQTSRTAPATSAITQPQVSQPAQPTSSAPANSAPIVASSAPPQSITVTAPPARSARSAAAHSQPAPAVVVEEQPAEPAKPNPLASAMDAHPVSSQRALTQNEAPALDPNLASGAQPGELPGVAASSPNVAPPPAEAPVKAGGKVEDPKLISSVMPVYPASARAAHMEGDVVIDTEVDKNGTVVRVKAVSGPLILRQAALDAVRRWKYQPSKLDGQPVSVELMVTVKFRL
jgi:periplasmic protein TonB